MFTDNAEDRSSSHGNERLPPVYDEILPEKELAIELCNNEAYGYISQYIALHSIIFILRIAINWYKCQTAHIH